MEEQKIKNLGISKKNFIEKLKKIAFDYQFIYL